MELSAPGLETNLIRLDPYEESHHEALRNIDLINHIWSATPLIPTGTSFDAYFNHTLRLGELGTGLGLAVINRREERLIGCAAFLNPNRLHRHVTCGRIWLEQACRGSGLVKHVQYLMLKRALEWRARRVQWMFSTRSAQAIEGVERLGATREGIMRQYLRVADGSWADIVVQSLVGEEIRSGMRKLGEEIGAVETASDA